MKTMSRLLGIILMLSLGLSSCNNDADKPNPTPEVEGLQRVDYLDVSSHSDWVYFSFKDKKAVEVSNEAEDLNWDVAFKRQNFKVNGKKGFSGKAVVAKSGKAGTEAFAAVISSAGKDFVGNTVATISVGFAHMKGGYDLAEKPHVTDQIGDYHEATNKEGQKYGACNYSNSYCSILVDMNQHGNVSAMYKPNPQVFIFRSADGKRHYKFQALDAVSQNGEKGGHLSFQYQKIQ